MSSLTLKNPITVEAKVNRSLKDTWALWTDPMHIIKWNFASDDWQTTFADNDLRPGGTFISRMEAKDGSVGFDFEGTYTALMPESKIEYALGDGRKVRVSFSSSKGVTLVKEEFEPEGVHSAELQQTGWQAILNNFKAYAEGKGRNELLKFAISIEAPAPTVYKRLLDDSSYRDWTKAFNAGSSFVGAWDKNSMIRFIGVDQNGKKQGMISRIRENIPGKFVSIEHLGMIDDGKDIMSGPAVDAWAGALENYRLRDSGNKTIVEVCLDAVDDHKAYFQETWPKALNRLKEICERK